MKDFDVTTPNPARIYDYMLGGKDNFTADRQAGDKIMSLSPAARMIARDNRRFLRCAVRYVAGGEVIQYIDIGSGLPTAENTHQIAQEEHPIDARVAYVDNDPIVLAHARALLADSIGVVAIGGDLREPESIFENSGLRKFIDFERPIAVLLVAVLHLLPDAEAHAAVEYIKGIIPSGSCVIISHATADQATAGELQVVQEAYSTLTLRTRPQVERFFDGFTLVDPGVVDINDWCPDHKDEIRGQTIGYCGVAFKP